MYLLGDYICFTIFIRINKNTNVVTVYVLPITTWLLCLFILLIVFFFSLFFPPYDYCIDILDQYANSLKYNNIFNKCMSRNEYTTYNLGHHLPLLCVNSLPSALLSTWLKTSNFSLTFYLTLAYFMTMLQHHISVVLACFIATSWKR